MVAEDMKTGEEAEVEAETGPQLIDAGDFATPLDTEVEAAPDGTWYMEVRGETKRYFSRDGFLALLRAQEARADRKMRQEGYQDAVGAGAHRDHLRKIIAVVEKSRAKNPKDGIYTPDDLAHEEVLPA